jgi:hypothetical protein
MATTGKERHLPVIRHTEPENFTPPSSLVWVLIGSIVIVSVWVPLAYIALTLGRQLGSHWLLSREAANLPSNSPVPVILIAGLVILSFASACAVGGAVIGRFAEQLRRWDAALAGMLGCIFVLFLAALGNALRPLAAAATVALSLVSVAVPAAILGGRWGKGRRTSQSQDG